MRKVAVVVAMALLVTTGCGAFDDETLSEMTLKRTDGDGRIEVHRDGDVLVVEDEISLEVDDRIVTEGNVFAKLQLEEGRFAAIAPRAQASIVDPQTLESERGSLLAITSAPMNVTFGSAEGELSDGILRVDRAPGATRAVTYRGRADLKAPGQRVSLETLYETSISAADFDVARPYRLDTGDPWDQEYLQAVIDLEETLTQLGEGLQSQLAGTRPTVGYFSELARGGNAAEMRQYIARNIRTSDLLIGFSVALKAPDALKDAIDEAFGLFGDGAGWGVAATIMDVRSGPLIAQINTIIVASEVASAEPGEEPELTADVFAGGVEEPGSEPIDGGDPGEPDPNDPDPEDPDKPEPTQEPECEDIGTCPEEEVKEEIDKLNPSPSPSGLLDSLP